MRVPFEDKAKEAKVKYVKVRFLEKACINGALIAKDEIRDVPSDFLLGGHPVEQVSVCKSGKLAPKVDACLKMAKEYEALKAKMQSAYDALSDEEKALLEELSDG